MWLWLLVLFWLSAAIASAEETAAKNAPEKLSNDDCLGCHLDPNTTRVVNGKTGHCYKRKAGRKLLSEKSIDFYHRRLRLTDESAGVLIARRS